MIHIYFSFRPSLQIFCHSNDEMHSQQINYPPNPTLLPQLPSIRLSNKCYLFDVPNTTVHSSKQISGLIWTNCSHLCIAFQRRTAVFVLSLRMNAVIVEYRIKQAFTRSGPMDPFAWVYSWRWLLTIR